MMCDDVFSNSNLLIIISFCLLVVVTILARLRSSSFDSVLTSDLISLLVFFGPKMRGNLNENALQSGRKKSKGQTICKAQGAIFILLCLNVIFCSIRVDSFSASCNLSSGRKSLKLFSTTEVSDKKDSSSILADQRTKQCKHCNELFATRNALFRHLRTDPICSIKDNPYNLEMMKQSVAMLFGYIGVDDESSKVPMAARAGEALQSSLMTALYDTVQSQFNVTRRSCEVEFVSWTQASQAKLRHRSLSQEAGCSASGDVMVVNVMVPKLMTSKLWNDVVKGIRQRLDDNIQLFSCELLVPSYSNTHSERSCTQRAYHYLLPFSWLPDASELTSWWRSDDGTPQDGKGIKKSLKPPDGLRKLKAALRTAECRKVSSEEIKSDVDTKLRVAAGRFGALGARERRPWHNFADPSLFGDASPNNEPVWRVVDRARIVDFMEDETGEVVAVVEIRGDDFTKQQARRIVATAVAIAHESLPSDFFEVARQVDRVVETPLAPPGRLYLADVRFHFDEMQFDGLPLFLAHKRRNLVESTPTEDCRRWVQSELLKLTSNDSVVSEEKEWLQDLISTTSARICGQLRHQEQLPLLSTDSSNGMAPPPSSYHATLSELRRIVECGSWPETSQARSNVIRKAKLDTQNGNGSFTIVNPSFGEENWESMPLGNSLFPDLVSSVFQLERDLAEEKIGRITIEGFDHEGNLGRPSSSHCAVNSNAQFTPHVDSGTGAGQSLSMIVGLGDYAGGELFVEGKPVDIRYKPIEFDGWKLRHWTNSFAGERFSLVWFTPETKGKQVEK